MNILQMSLSASTLIILILGLRLFQINKIPKITFSILWGIVLVRLLIPMRIPYKFGLFTFTNSLTNSFTQAVISIKIPTKQLLDFGQTESSTILSPNLFISYTQLLTIGWVIGFAVMMLIYITSFMKSYRLIQEAIPINDNEFITKRMERWSSNRTIKIYRSDRISTPITCGIIHPIIILPCNIDKENHKQLNYVLTHELVHIIRYDTLQKMLSIVALCIHWFNPLVWLMYICYNRDIEIACDEKVINLYGEGNKSDYALTLLRLAEQQKGYVPVLGNSFGKNIVEKRIVSIMKYKKTTLRNVIFPVILICIASTIFVTPIKANTEYNMLYDPEINTKLYISDNRDKNEEARLWYPVNENGYTYGANDYEIHADLIAVAPENGILGYVYWDDLDGEQPNTPEEAIAIMDKWKNGRSVLIYESDGETILGIFDLSA